MTEPAAPAAARPRRRLLPLLAGLVLALPAAGGAFYAVHSGLLFGTAAAPEAAPQALGDVAFVPLPPLVVSLGREPVNRHLRLAAQLEVPRAMAAEVTLVMPRILDVLNGYLRAVAMGELEDPAALVRLRAQMLRRIQMVAGEGRVRDLLVTEFVLN
ncbi:MAG: flagellar basal body-associated FliL family protein [Rhodobacteraceae bacterium]|jgi:flagellar FliL protein|nr:flagellar basal body-associated FliL family protein [Paracoccaceae bacterium]